MDMKGGKAILAPFKSPNDVGNVPSGPGTLSGDDNSVPVQRIFTFEAGTFDEPIDLTTLAASDNIGGTNMGGDYGSVHQPINPAHISGAGGGPGPQGLCKTTINPATGLRRNLVIWPPPRCTSSRLGNVSKLRDFYAKLRRTCFNKLFVGGDPTEIKAAIDAGWKLSDLIIDVKCNTQKCCIETPGCSDSPLCIENLLKSAKDYYASKWGDSDNIPGFYEYYIDEPYAHGCGLNDVLNLYNEARNLDDKYNGGVKTNFVVGSYETVTHVGLPWPHLKGTEFRDLGKAPSATTVINGIFDLTHVMPLDFLTGAHLGLDVGFMYTTYDSNRKIGISDMDALISPFASARNTSGLWATMVGDFNFLEVTKDIYGNPVYKAQSRYPLMFQYANQFGFGTMGLYASGFSTISGDTKEWDGKTLVYDTAGRQIGEVDACAEGKPMRQQYPDEDDCRCNLFFNFLKDFEQAAKDAGWIEDV